MAFPNPLQDLFDAAQLAASMAFRAAALPFTTAAPTLNLTPETRNPGMLQAMKSNPKFSHMKVALVDMTRWPLLVFSGWNEGVMGFAASILKIGAMLAAYRLRERLRNAASLAPSGLLPADDG